MKKSKLVVLGLTALLTLSGCGESNTPSESESESESISESIDRSVKSVTLDQHELTLEEDGAANLIATINPENALNKKLNWESSNEEVAMVSGIGKVRALSAGTATITVSSDEDASIKDTCVVTVTEKDRTIHVESVSLNKTSLTIEKGDIEALIATVLPNNATDKSVTWDSSNKAVATVENGIVTAVNKGTSIITVTSTDGAKVANCEVTVTDSYVAVESVAISGSDVVSGAVSFKLGEKITTKLTATVLPENASNKGVVWSSSDETKVTVSSTGQLTAVAETTEPVTITAKSADDATKSDSVTVTVAAADIVDPTVHVTSISLGEDKELEFDISDEGTTLTATVNPSNAYDRVVDFEIVEGSDVVELGDKYGDNSIAVKFLKVGEAKIKATSNESSEIYDEVTITISDSVNHITELSFKDTMPEGVLKSDTLSLGNYIDVQTQSGEAATDPTLIYESSDPSVASINASGVLTALTKGTTTITVYSRQEGNGDGQPKATFTLRVKWVSVGEITLNERSATLDVKETLQLSATLVGAELDEYDQPRVIENPSVTWSTSNESVAKVNASTGIVTAVSKGTATITATAAKQNDDDPEKTASCVVTVRDADVKIIGLSKPQTITDYESAVKNLDDSIEDTTTPLYENANVDKGTFFKYAEGEEEKALYRVGDQGVFKFAPVARARNNDNEEISYNLVDFDYKVEKLSGAGSDATVIADVTEFVSYKQGGFFSFDSDDLDLDNYYRLTVTPDSDSEDFIVPKDMTDSAKSIITFKLIEGYNAYSLAELSLFDNHTPNSNNPNDWSETREAGATVDGQALPTSVTGGIILHKDIELTTSNLPSEMKYSSSDADDIVSDTSYGFADWWSKMNYSNATVGREAIVGSPKDGTSIFEHQTHNNSEKFCIEGNFFTFNASSVKKIAVLKASDNSDTSYGSLWAGQTGDGSHSQIFDLNDKNSEITSSCGWDEANRDTFSLRNIAILGNCTDYSTMTALNEDKGGLIGVKAEELQFNAENVLFPNAFVTFMSQSRRVRGNDAITAMSLDRVKAYDAYSNHIYLFGAKNTTVSNSWLTDTCGSTIMMDEHTTLNTGLDWTAGHASYELAYCEANIVDSYVNNPIAGNEAWFANHEGSSQFVTEYMVKAGLGGGSIVAPTASDLNSWIGAYAHQVYSADSSQDVRTITSPANDELYENHVNLIALCLNIGGFSSNAFPELQSTLTLKQGDEYSYFAPGTYTSMQSPALLGGTAASYDASAANVLDPTGNGTNALVGSSYGSLYLAPAYVYGYHYKIGAFVKTYSYSNWLA